MERRGLIKATFAVIVWGASFIATKIALNEVSPVTVVWLRFGMGVCVLGIAVGIRHDVAPVSPRNLGFFALLGFLGITFHQWLQSTGLITARASTSAWIVSTTPIFIAILGRIVLREKLGRARLIGIFVATAGVLLVVGNGDMGALLHGSFGTSGDLLVLISAVNWAVFSVMSRHGLRKAPASLMMLWVMGFGWLFTSLLLVAGPGLSEIGLLTGRGWAAIAFLGICCSGLAYVFWYDALKTVPASQVGSLLYLEPLVAAATAAAIIGERIVPLSVLGGGIILLGVWFVTRQHT